MTTDEKLSAVTLQLTVWAPVSSPERALAL